MKTLNIKITNIETGEEIFNEDTNAIICGISDNEGDCAVVSDINGSLKAIVGALDAVNQAENKTIKSNPVLSNLKGLFDNFIEDVKREVKENA